MFRIETLRGLLRSVSLAGPISLDQVGISQEDWETTTGDVPWILTDRRAVRATLDQLTFGSLEHAGMGRFEVPAEWLAAVIAFYVQPVNWLTAAKYQEGGYSAEDLGANGVGEREPASASRIFALMCQLHPDTDVAPHQSAFEKRVGIELARANRGMRGTAARKSQAA